MYGGSYPYPTPTDLNQQQLQQLPQAKGNSNIYAVGP
jgi:hypothetical protein